MGVVSEYKCVLRETKERLLSDGSIRTYYKVFWHSGADVYKGSWSKYNLKWQDIVENHQWNEQYEQVHVNTRATAS